MDYKLLKENEDHYVMQHPDGSTFKVAKKGLKDELHKKIRGYADGGIVEPVSSEMPSDKITDPTLDIPMATPAQSLYEQEKERFGLGNVNLPKEYIENMAAQSVAAPIARQEQAAANEKFLAEKEKQDEINKRLELDTAYNENAKRLGIPLRDTSYAQAQAPESQPTPSQAQETPVPSQATTPSTSAYDLAASAYRNIAKEQSNLAKQQEQIYGGLQKDINEGNRIHDDRLDQLYKENAEFEKKLATAEIDPNRMFKNMSTGNKLAAGIGIILGGIGQGLIGGQNEALKVINNAIDRDIDSQKQDVEKTQSLYRMNLEKMKDERLARDATKIQYMTMAELKLKQAMAKSQSKEAIYNGQLALAQIQQAKDQMINKSAVDQVVKLAQSNPDLITPEIAQRLPKEDRERFVPGAGFALTAEGAKKIREEIKPDRDDAISAIQQMKNLRQKYGREIMSRAAVAEADSLKGILKGKLRTFLVGPGAVSESEQKILNDVIQDPTAILTMDSSVMKRLDTLENAINNSFYNKAKLNGLSAPSQAQQPEVKTMNGVPYQKVPGGWTPLKTGR